MNTQTREVTGERKAARKPYKIHVRYGENGRNFWKRFASLEEAKRAADDVFQRTGIVLTIIKD